MIDLIEIQERARRGWRVGDDHHKCSRDREVLLEAIESSSCVKDSTVDKLVEIGDEIVRELDRIKDMREKCYESFEWMTKERYQKSFELMTTLVARWNEATLQVIDDRHKGSRT